MGYYGDEKRKQMFRSILPARSSSRKAIKEDFNRRRRNNRRQNNHILNRYSGGTADEAIDMYDEFGEDFEVYVEMHDQPDWDGDLVQERRNQDKLNHFVHWATKITQEYPTLNEKVGYMKSIMPDGLIGEHAMSHVVSSLEWEVEKKDYLSPYRAQLLSAKTARELYVDELSNTIRSIAIHGTAKDNIPRKKMNDFLLKNIKPFRYKIFENSDVNGGVLHVWPSKYRAAQYVRIGQCDIIPQMNGYHDCERFIKEVLRNKSDKCVAYPHVHDWDEVVARYFNIEKP